VDNDGQLDLLCLEAETYAGQKIRGEETIRIVP